MSPGPPPDLPADSRTDLPSDLPADREVRPAVGHPVLPRRDPAARARLRAVAARSAPVVLARDRVLRVEGPVGAALPGHGLTRGATVAIDGPIGGGVTSVAAALLAAATGAGEWAAVVDPDASFGAVAAHEAGVALERCAVVRPVPPDRWGAVVAALLDGVALVVAVVPTAVSVGDTRRLVARARERAAVLVACGRWPTEAAVRLHARGGPWPGLGAGYGRLEPRPLTVAVETKAARTIARVG